LLALSFTLLGGAIPPQPEPVSPATCLTAPSQQRMADAAHETTRIFGSDRKLPIYTLEERDYLIRTVVFEAGSESDEGKAAVVHVILNRIKSDRWADTIKGVVTAPWQFEPWMTRRKEIKALSADDPRYQDAARIADAVLSGDVPDPTEGATHFLNPDIVRKRRGGSLPAWARNGGQSIGRHTFYAPYQRSTTQQASLLFALAGGKSSC
jgi:spore germination cell wall hydrolase CwlJ-like protein